MASYRRTYNLLRFALHRRCGDMAFHEAGQQQKHLAQMLDELEAGGVYMGMTWNG